MMNSLRDAPDGPERGLGEEQVAQLAKGRTEEFTSSAFHPSFLPLDDAGLALSRNFTSLFTSVIALWNFR
jgi:hypothetical protein